MYQEKQQKTTTKKPKQTNKYWNFSLVVTTGLYFQKPALWLNIRPASQTAADSLGYVEESIFERRDRADERGGEAHKCQLLHSTGAHSPAWYLKKALLLCTISVR